MQEFARELLSDTNLARRIGDQCRKELQLSQNEPLAFCARKTVKKKKEEEEGKEKEEVE